MKVDAGGIATERVGPWEAAEFEYGRRLDEGAVHVWAFPGPTPRSADCSPQVAGSRNSSVQACVAAYTGGEAIHHDNSGRPLVRGLSASVSSTRGLVVLALGRGVVVGVDAEWLRPVSVVGPVRVLSPIERDLIPDGPSDRVHRVLRLWTRKEAWSKLDGRGIDLSWPGITVTGAWPEVGTFQVALSDQSTSVVTLEQVRTCEVSLAVSGSLRSARAFIHR